MPAPTRAACAPQLLQPDDGLVAGRIDPATRRGDPAASRGVVCNREYPLRGILDGHRDTGLDQGPSIRRHDGHAAFSAPHLMTDP